MGAGLGGLALHAGTRSAYLGVFALDAVGFLVCAALLWRLPSVPPTRGDRKGNRGLGVLRDRPYVLVTFLNTVLLLRMPLLSLGIPLWITERTEAPAWLVSALFVLNTVAVMAFQVPMARGVTDLPTATRTIRRSGIVMAVLRGVRPVVRCLPGSRPPSWWRARSSRSSPRCSSPPTLATGLRPGPVRPYGRVPGLFRYGVTVARTMGPLVLTALLVGWGTPGWLLLGALMAGASYAMGPAARWAASRDTGAAGHRADVRPRNGGARRTPVTAATRN